MIDCKICGKQFNNLLGLSKHIPGKHKEISGAEYYIRYMHVGEIPTCYCGNSLRCSLRGFGQYCSKKCTNESKDRSAKILNSKKEKYGENMSAIYEKQQATMSSWGDARKKEYRQNLSAGVKAGITQETIEKRKATCIERYGENFFRELGHHAQSAVDFQEAAEKEKALA